MIIGWLTDCWYFSHLVVKTLYETNQYFLSPYFLIIECYFDGLKFSRLRVKSRHNDTEHYRVFHINTYCFNYTNSRYFKLFASSSTHGLSLVWT